MGETLFSPAVEGGTDGSKRLSLFAMNQESF